MTQSTVGYQYRLICGALRRCPVFKEQSPLRYALYGRMGVDCEWMLLSQNLASYEAAMTKREHYKKTWRHVICKHYEEV